MKIGILSASYPPKFCGVGDAVPNLSAAFRAQGHDVSVFTAQKESDFSDSNLIYIPHPWQLTAFMDLAKKMRKLELELLIVEFAPILVSKNQFGVHLLFPFYLLLLKFLTKAKILLHTHESNYPAGLNLIGILIGFPQLIQFYLQAIFSSKVSFSYLHLQRLWTKRLPFCAHKFLLTPSGPTILDQAEPQNFIKLREDFKIPTEAGVLLYFGGLHPTVYFDHLFSALEASHGSPENVLVLLGIRPADCNKLLRRHNKLHLEERVFATGPLPTQSIVDFYALADLILLPYMDGISTRRSTAMNAFRLGKAVVSTREWSSVGVDWENFCMLTPAEDKERFAKTVAALMNDPSERSRLGKNAGDYFQKNYDWAEIAKMYLQ